MGARAADAGFMRCRFNSPMSFFDDDATKGIEGSAAAAGTAV